MRRYTAEVKFERASGITIYAKGRNSVAVFALANAHSLAVVYEIYD